MQIIKRPRPIVFLAQQRSGTTALQKAFESTKQIRSFGEIFQTQGGSLEQESNFFFFKEKYPPKFVVPRDEDVRGYFHSFLNYLHDISDRPHYLLDIKYNSWYNIVSAWQNNFERPFQLRILMELGSPIIHIVRTNVLLQALSMEYARATDKWHYMKDHTASAVKLNVNTQALLYVMRLSDRNTQFFRDVLKSYANYTEVEYEKVFLHSKLETEYLTQCVSSLRIPKEFTGYLPFKKTPIDIPSLVSNRNELLATLRPTEYWDMAQEVFP